MKMLLFVTIAALLGVGYAAPADIIAQESTNATIQDQLKDIGHLLPKDLIKSIAEQHLKTDEEFKAAVKYLQTPEWVKLVETVRDNPDWIALKNYLNESGLNLDVIIHCIESFAQNVTVQLDPKVAQPKKSFKKFLIDVEQNLPTVKILTGLHEKMGKGAGLQLLFEKISKQESRSLIEKVIAVPEVKRMLDILADMDVDLYEVLSLMYTFFGWGEFKKP